MKTWTPEAPQQVWCLQTYSETPGLDNYLKLFKVDTSFKNKLLKPKSKTSCFAWWNHKCSADEARGWNGTTNNWWKDWRCIVNIRNTSQITNRRQKTVENFQDFEIDVARLVLSICTRKHNGMLDCGNVHRRCNTSCCMFNLTKDADVQCSGFCCEFRSYMGSLWKMREGGSSHWWGKEITMNWSRR